MASTEDPTPSEPQAVTCQARRYAPHRACDPDGARFDVVYTTTGGVETDRTAACFTHGMAEVDRHYAAGGIARCDLAGPLRPPTRGGTR